MDVRPEVLVLLLTDVDAGRFDDLARWVATCVDAPVGLVTVLDDRDQRFAGMHGLGGTSAGRRRGTPIEQSLCRIVADDGRALRLGDGRRHRTLRTHPAVVTSGVRAYLGVPLRLPDHSRIGAVCVADARPRRWTTHDLAAVGTACGLVERRLQALVDTGG
jgi:GAF domain-containing protein